MNSFKPPREYEVFLDILNQIFEIEKKLKKIEESNSIHRNLTRLKEIFESQLSPDQSGFHIENPIGQSYDETRLDCDANIAGEGSEDLVIIEVIKPIIRLKKEGFNQIIQKGIVIVQSQNN
jgi:hypothetical protein